MAEGTTRRETKRRSIDPQEVISGSSHLPPNPKRLIHALRSIGYTLEQAVADIIDNSISASARKVLVRIETTDSYVERVFLADDGKGMADSTLQKAMEFGAEMNQGSSSLGKYGMGMKLASLSQGEEVIVLSRQAQTSCGRRWTVEGIGDHWRCDVITPEAAARQLDNAFHPLNLNSHGTVVIWSRLDRIKASKAGLERTMGNILTRLKCHIGIHFHRFIEQGSFDVYLEWTKKGQRDPVEKIHVEALNPFGGPNDISGDEEYPKSFALNVPSVGPLELNAHIWAPKSESQQYKLDGKVAARQGIYFYRNNRLIQAGGWNDSKDSTEPHSSLARVSIDLPPSFDSHFSLDVKKCAVRESPAFSEALKQAKAADGTKFTEYRAAAIEVYRKAARKDSANFPLVPGAGISTKLQRALRETIAPKERRVRKVQFKWCDLETGEVFEIDRDNLTIRLNKRFRRKLLGDERSSSTDAPILKTLLFLLVRDDLDSGRITQKKKEWLGKVDEALKLILKSFR